MRIFVQKTHFEDLFFAFLAPLMMKFLIFNTKFEKGRIIFHRKNIKKIFHAKRVKLSVIDKHELVLQKCKVSKQKHKKWLHFNTIAEIHNCKAFKTHNECRGMHFLMQIKLLSEKKAFNLQQKLNQVLNAFLK